MDLRLTPLTSASLGNLSPALGGARVGMPKAPLAPGVSGTPGASGTSAVGGAGFSTAFKDALQAVSRAQDQSTELQNQVQLGNPRVSLEETMLAMQKAQIGFQATLHVRNRMMQAYTDVMNMQV